MEKKEVHILHKMNKKDLDQMWVTKDDHIVKEFTNRFTVQHIHVYRVFFLILRVFSLLEKVNGRAFSRMNRNSNLKMLRYGKGGSAVTLLIEVDRVRILEGPILFVRINPTGSSTALCLV
jgi:hypothetical protein